MALLILALGGAAGFTLAPSIPPVGNRFVQQRAFGVTSSLALQRRLRRGVRRHAAAISASSMQVASAPKDFMIYNTLARDKVPFKPMAEDGKTVKMYTCGPTIYDFAHIGNFRAFLTYDLVKRWLQYCGYDVDHVCNLTDVDDKIITRMKRDNVGLKELTDKYANFFFEDLDR